jgi:hypothetical protein
MRNIVVGTVAVLALLEGCRGVKIPEPGAAFPTDPGEVLVVDLKPQTRTNLEAEMQRGLVVVKYTATEVKILDCLMEGSYGFIGTTRRQRTVKLESASETKANLPFSAGSINAKLGVDFFNESRIDIAAMMIGVRRTTRRDAPRELLSGADCKDATHIVESATMGAFAMARSAKAQNKTFGEIWQIAGGHENKELADLTDKDGDLAACEKSTSKDTSPIEGCGAPIFVRLRKLETRTVNVSGVQVEDAPCATGFVRDPSGKCAENPPVHVCRIGDIVDCTAQCDRGQPESCGILGFAAHYGKPEDKERARVLYEKACKGGAQFGCAGLGVLEKEKKNFTEALRLFTGACDAGNARGCQNLGVMYFNGEGVEARPAEGLALSRRACDGGDALACYNVGRAYEKAIGGEKDLKRAAAAYERACEGGDAPSCGSAGQMLAEGMGVERDPSRGRKLIQRACEAGEAEACAYLKSKP